MTQGLVLHLESESGVAAKGGKVTGWNDQSGRKNHLNASGDPVLKASATPSGRPAIALDDSKDKLERVHRQAKLNGLPMNNDDRSVFFVARYNQARKWAGLVWGAGKPNETYGLVVNPNTGKLAVQGWGRGNDHSSNASGIGAGWQLQSSVHKNSTSELFQNGREVLSFRHSFNTKPERLVIADEIAGLGSIAVDVAAVLVYDRALNPTERQSVESYLQQKYLRASNRNAGPSVQITAPADKAEVDAGTKVTLQAEASDAEDGNLSGSIQWSSNRDGNLGRGESVTTVLSAGNHNITAAVTDSRNAKDQAKIKVTVAEPKKEPAGKPKPKPTPEKPAPKPQPAEKPTAGKGQKIKLFDGKSLDGFYVWSMGEGKNPKEKIFTVKDGLLRVASAQKYAALVSEKEYSNYIMTLEFKWGDQTYGHRKGKARDAGILLHSHGKDGGWKGRLMANLEVQIIEGGMGDLMMLRGKEPMHMSVATTKHRCDNRSWYCRGDYRWDPSAKGRKSFKGTADYAETVHWYGWDSGFRDVAGYRGKNDLEKRRGEWNQFIVVADEDRIEVYFNGVKVNEAFNVKPSKGRVQLESEMAEYYVRRWDLELLD